MRRKQFVWGLTAVLLFVALAAGWAAYANIPDSSGVIHACYRKTSPNQGTIRVIDTEKGQTCLPGENALDWNQTGPPGSPGPGATTFTTTVALESSSTLATLDNGVTIQGDCDHITSGALARILIYVSTGDNLQASGTRSSNRDSPTVNALDINSARSFGATGNEVNLDGLVRDSTMGKFAHIDVHGTAGFPCTFWGMIIPSE